MRLHQLLFAIILVSVMVTVLWFGKYKRVQAQDYI